MARIRTVKPELASDRKLASVSRDARYTFVLLISQADDDGLVRAEPRQLLGTLYPFDHDVSSDILEEWLAELVEIGAVRWRVTHDGMRVAEIVKWGRHQHIKNRSKPFLLNHLTPETETLPQPSVEPTEEGVKQSVGFGGAESRVLSPESRVLSPPAADATNGVVSTATAPRSRSQRSPPLESPLFLEAWADYPKRPNNNRASAWRAWTARVRGGEEESVMLSGTRNYAGFVRREKTEPRYVKLAATFYGPDKHYLSDYGPLEAEVVQMTDDFGVMRPHRRNAVGEWQEISQGVEA